MIRGAKMPSVKTTALRTTQRRGTVLFAVLVIGVAAVLVVAGLLSVMEAEVTARAAERRETAMRTLATSAVSIVGDRLDAQRERILSGEVAEAPAARIELYEDAGRVGLIRLLPVGPGGQIMVAENGKLDLNAVDADALIATGFVDEELAARIISARSRRGGFRSAESLLEVPGITPELMEGDEPPEDFAAQASGEEADLRSRILERLGGAQPRGLIDVLSVHAAEPSLQRSGVRRISLNREWSPELGERLDERFGAGTGEGVREIMQQQRFTDDRTIVSVLRLFSVDQSEWALILDALTGRTGDEVTGRVDINVASPVVLAAAGFTSEQAEEIVAARAMLSDDERWTVTWLVTRGILTGEELGEMIDRITVRSWCYRVRLAVLEVDAADDTIVHAGPLVFDVVYDLVDPVVRVAALREVTHLPLARVLADIMLFDDPFDDDDVDGEEPGLDVMDDEEAILPLPEFGSDSAMRGGFMDFGQPFAAPPDDDRGDDGMDSAPASQGSPASRRIGRWRLP